MTKQEGKVGMVVFFGRKNGEKTKGTIVKVARKNFKVRQDEQRGVYKDHKVGTVWTVPPSLCTPVDQKAENSDHCAIWERRRARNSRRPELVNVLTGQRYVGRPGESEDSLFGRLANGLYD